MYNNCKVFSKRYGSGRLEYFITRSDELYHLHEDSTITKSNLSAGSALNTLTEVKDIDFKLDEDFNPYIKLPRDYIHLDRFFNDKILKTVDEEGEIVDVEGYYDFGKAYLTNSFYITLSYKHKLGI